MEGDDTSIIDHSNGTNRKPESSHPEQEQDCISALDDELLALILSLLPDTKCAIRTSALSKRWRHVWTRVSNLTFRLFPGSVSTLDTNHYLFPPFAKFVDEALASYSPKAEFHKFRLVVDKYYMEKLHPNTRVDAWINFAVLRGVEELILDFNHKWYNFDIWRHNIREFDCYKLPQILYDCPSLTVMKAWFCDVVPERSVYWELLRVLEIGYANLNPIIIQTILEGSSVLESLKLFQCLGIDRLDIASRTLKHLVVDNIWLSREQRVYSDYFISGPSLQNLQISSTGFHKWIVMNLSSLLSVRIDFEIRKVWNEDFPEQHVVDYGETCRHTVEEILEKVGHVEELKLGKWCIRVLSSMEIKGISSPSLKCKSLALQVRSFCERDLPGIASLLRSSSKLERIQLDLSSIRKNKEFDIHPIFGDHLSGNDYWTSFKHEEQGLLSNLKTVEIFGFTPELYEQGGLVFEFIAFLLKRAKVLQKMVIRE